MPGDSDIGQLARLQRTLGSIKLSEWPEAADLPDWGKICFAACDGTPLGRLLPGAPLDAIDLLGAMLRCDKYIICLLLYTWLWAVHMGGLSFREVMTLKVVFSKCNVALSTVRCPVLAWTSMRVHEM